MLWNTAMTAQKTFPTKSWLKLNIEPMMMQIKVQPGSLCNNIMRTQGGDDDNYWQTGWERAESYLGGIYSNYTTE